MDSDGDLYIADSQNFRIRRVNLATGVIVTTGDTRVYRDAQHGFPCALSVDAAGDLYVADSGNSQIRRLPADLAHQSAAPLAGPSAVVGAERLQNQRDLRQQRVPAPLRSDCV